MIEGYFTPHKNPWPWLDVAVLIDGDNSDWVLIPSVVDTGAATTCVHAIDAITRLGMSPASLDPAMWSGSISNIGATAGSLSYLTKEARYGFLQNDGSWITIPGDIRISELSSGATPSLLGWDLLRHFKTTVIGSPRSVQLECLD